MTHIDKEPFVQMLKAIFEVYGATLSTDAVSIWWGVLENYPLEIVSRTLTQHVKESRFAPKPADVLDVIRSADGRPGPEEAWSLIPKSEGASVVWTEEMAKAYGSVSDLINRDDLVAARLAFVEQYRTLVRAARDANKPAKWMPTFGHDWRGRELAVLNAAEKGRLTVAQIKQILPGHMEDDEFCARLAAIEARPDKPHTAIAIVSKPKRVAI